MPQNRKPANAGVRGLRLALLFCFGAVSMARAQTTIDPDHAFAWAGNIGFTNWRPSVADGVAIGDNFCSGFIYIANTGWTSMGDGTPLNGTQYSNASADDFGVNCSPGSPGEKDLRGFAYGANIGWVNFEATGNPRVILSTGQLRGFVYSANCGWINLDDPTIYVQTGAATPTPTPTATPPGTPTPTPPGTPTPTPPGTPTPTPPGTPTPAPTITPIGTPTPTPGGTTPTPTPGVTPTPSPTPSVQVINLSTRMRVQTGDHVGIGGFIITGSTPKHVLLRAIGPSLVHFGISGVLADPVLELRGSGAFATVTNNDWRDTQEAAIQATGIPPTNDFESAIDVTLVPGAYTAVVRGTGNTSGTALVEIYDLNQTTASKLGNISTRAFVSTGHDIVIAGFMLNDVAGEDRVIVRGLGPSLAAAGVPNVMDNPTLQLRDSEGTLLGSNNDWQDSSAQAAEIVAAGLAPSSSLEAAIAATLPPGLYTALLAGLNNGTGNGLVEIYDRGAP